MTDIKAHSTVNKATHTLPQSLRQERLFTFDTKQYDFRELIGEVLLPNTESAGASLAKLHHTPDGERELAKAGFMSQSKHHRAPVSGRNIFNKRWLTAYQTEFDGTFRKMLGLFVQEVIAPLLDCDHLVFQRRPTLRVHLPGDKPLGTKVHRQIQHT